jgi:hypothetical protein
MLSEWSARRRTCYDDKQQNNTHSENRIATTLVSVFHGTITRRDWVSLMPSKKKLDLYQVHKREYVTPRAPVIVKVSPARYLSIEGKGAPGSGEFQAKIGALYNVTFTIKMAKKFAGQDYTVCKLEGLWWTDGGEKEFLQTQKDQWCWKLMIRTPDFIGTKELEAAILKLRAKGKPAEVSSVALESLKEGTCVQVLHIGPYDAEPATIAAMRDLVLAKGLSFHGLHHEIYLSDPRRVASSKLRTILRRPVH